jgi:type II secretory pathway component PulF
LDQSVNRRMAFVEPVLVGTLSLISVLILFSVMLPLLGVMSSI